MTLECVEGEEEAETDDDHILPDPSLFFSHVYRCGRLLTFIISRCVYGITVDRSGRVFIYT